MYTGAGSVSDFVAEPIDLLGGERFQRDRDVRVAESALLGCLSFLGGIEWLIVFTSGAEVDDRLEAVTGEFLDIGFGRLSADCN